MSGIACGTLFQVVVLVVLIVGCEEYIYSIGSDHVQHQVIKFNDDGLNISVEESDLEAGEKEGLDGMHLHYINKTLSLCMHVCMHVCIMYVCMTAWNDPTETLKTDATCRLHINAYA